MKRFKIELKSHYVYCTTYNHLYIYEKYNDSDNEYNKFVSSILISSPEDIDNIINELYDIKNKLIKKGN